MTGSAATEYVYGFHTVSSLLRQSPEAVIRVYIENNKASTRVSKLLQLLASQNVEHGLLTREQIHQKVGRVVHQGVIAKVNRSRLTVETELADQLPKLALDETILILDAIQDPANLGACLRVADAAGVKSIILPKDKCASLTPVARKVAAGAAETVNIHTVTNLVRSIELLKQHDFWIVGLTESVAESLYDYDFQGRVAVVVGNEGKGLRQLTRRSCDCLLSIPMAGQVESLNVAVATGITLFEVARQRNAQK